MANAKVKGSGTRQSPWVLKTPPGTSEFTAYQDETLDLPTLIVQVGKTEVRNQLRGLDDLHTMLKKHGDWMPSAAPTSRNRRPRARSRHGPARRRIRSAAGTG